MKSPTGSIMACSYKVRWLKFRQQCILVGGNDLVYQVQPLDVNWNKTWHTIDVPNYSVMSLSDYLDD